MSGRGRESPPITLDCDMPESPLKFFQAVSKVPWGDVANNFVQDVARSVRENETTLHDLYQAANLYNTWRVRAQVEPMAEAARKYLQRGSSGLATILTGPLWRGIERAGPENTLLYFTNPHFRWLVDNGYQT